MACNGNPLADAYDQIEKLKEELAEVISKYRKEFSKVCDLRVENEQLWREKLKLQELWVTVNLSCNPPDYCNDPIVLKRYMKACMDKANEYEQCHPKGKEIATHLER